MSTLLHSWRILALWAATFGYWVMFYFVATNLDLESWYVQAGSIVGFLVWVGICLNLILSKEGYRKTGFGMIDSMIIHPRRKWFLGTLPILLLLFILVPFGRGSPITRLVLFSGLATFVVLFFIRLQICKKTGTTVARKK